MNEITLYVERKLAGQSVRERISDKYYDATAMCKAAGKLFAHWRENTETEAFLEELSLNIGIPIFRKNKALDGPHLIESRPGVNGGTWVHPKVAIALAMWCSPQFHVKVVNWIYEEGSRERDSLLANVDKLNECMQTLAGHMQTLAGHVSDTKMELQGLQSDVSGMRKNIAEIGSSLDDFKGEVRSRLGHRKKFQKNIVNMWRFAIARYFHKLCPCCGEREIVDDRGNKLPSTQEDHCTGRHNVGFRDGWLICKPCHDQITAGVITAMDANRRADIFHDKAAEKLHLSKTLDLSRTWPGGLRWELPFGDAVITSASSGTPPYAGAR